MGKKGRCLTEKSNYAIKFQMETIIRIHFNYFVLYLTKGAAMAAILHLLRSESHLHDNVDGYNLLITDPEKENSTTNEEDACFCSP